MGLVCLKWEHLVFIYITLLLGSAEIWVNTKIKFQRVGWGALTSPGGWMLVTKLLNCSAGLHSVAVQVPICSSEWLQGSSGGRNSDMDLAYFFRMENANVSVGVGKNILLLPSVSKIGWEVKTRLVFNVSCLSVALVLFAWKLQSECVQLPPASVCRAGLWERSRKPHPPPEEIKGSVTIN